MRFVSLFMSLLVVTTAVAQKPLDRGVHKRKTGGVSVLWGKKKMHDVDRSELDAPNELLPRETLEPVVMRIPVAKVVALESPTGEWNPAPATLLREDRLVHRVLRPLKRRGFAVVAGPASVDRLLRRDHALKPHPAREKAPLDWMSFVGFVLIALALLFLDSAAGLWLPGLILSILGKRRTRRGRFRGRRLAVMGVLLGLVYPLVYFLGVVLGAVTISF